MSSIVSNEETAPIVPSQPTPIIGRKRLTGLDLFRIIAAFGVIVIHSGMTANGVTSNALRVVHFFSFAVPFFLLASFYFAAASVKPEMAIGPAIARRAKRLIIPYALWTLVYVGLRAGKYAFQHQPARLMDMLSDPVGVFILGGSGVQLYFLPLLFIGLVLLLCIAGSISRLPSWALFCLFFLACVTNAELIHSGNAYDISTNRGFQHLLYTPSLGISGQPIRLVFAIVCDAIRCLPLIFLAFLLVRYLTRLPQSFPSGWLLMFGAALLSPAILGYALPLSFGEEVLGLGAFLIAWSISSSLPASDFIAKLGSYSFGIYLCHQVFMEMLEVVTTHHASYHRMQGPVFLLGVSLIVFAASWLTVAIASRGNQVLRMGFALES